MRAIKSSDSLRVFARGKLGGKLSGKLSGKGNRKPSGFTLIELIMGMLVMVIAIGFMMAALLPRERQSADQILQIRAAEIAQSLMSEISSKAFDDNSDKTGGLIRCNESSGPPCTASNALGPEVGERRASFNDVDDFHGMQQFADALGQDLQQQYAGFSLTVQVFYDNNYDGTADTYMGDGSDVGNSLAKLIQITVTTPLGTPIRFASYRSNFE